VGLWSLCARGPDAVLQGHQLHRLPRPNVVRCRHRAQGTVTDIFFLFSAFPSLPSSNWLHLLVSVGLAGCEVA
jgi:hypothetical protein